MQAQRHVRALGDVLRGGIDGYLAKRDLFRASAGHVLVLRFLEPEVLAYDCPELVTSRRAVEEVRLEHRVEAHARESDSGTLQHVCEVLEIVADLCRAFLLQHWLQQLQHVLPRQLRRRAGIVVSQRDVRCTAGLDAE